MERVCLLAFRKSVNSSSVCSVSHIMSTNIVLPDLEAKWQWYRSINPSLIKYLPLPRMVDLGSQEGKYLFSFLPF